MTHRSSALSSYVFVALAFAGAACAESVEPSASHAAETAGGAGVAGAPADTGGTGGTTLLDLGGTSGDSGGTAGFQPVPVRSLAGLSSITFYERTGGDAPNAYTFDVNGPELQTELADPLAEGNYDIPGAPSEYYDVYYSDAQGVFDANGSYLTISGTYGRTAPLGGGLNLAEISLNFSGVAPEFGNYVASFVTLGDNQDPSSVPLCIDGDLQTNTTMGNTVDASGRLRLTLGFLSSSGPPPIK